MFSLTPVGFVAITIAAALVLAGKRLYAYSDHGGPADWSAACLLAALAILGLNTPLAQFEIVRFFAALLVIVTLGLLLRGLIRRFSGRDNETLNRVARHLKHTVALLAAVHLALSLPTGQINAVFIDAVIFAGLMFCLMVVAVVLEQDASPRLRLLVMRMGGALMINAATTLYRLMDTGLALSGANAAPGADIVSAMFQLLAGGALLYLVRTICDITCFSERDASRMANDNRVIERRVRRHLAFHPEGPVVLLAIEIDDFEHQLCELGAASAASQLALIGQLISQNCRETDAFTCSDRALFQVAALGATQEDALALAERIRMAVAGTCTAGSACSWPCSVSIGLSRPFCSVVHCSDADGQSRRALNKARSLGGNLTISHQLLVGSGVPATSR